MHTPEKIVTLTKVHELSDQALADGIKLLDRALARHSYRDRELRTELEHAVRTNNQRSQDVLNVALGDLAEATERYTARRSQLANERGRRQMQRESQCDQ